MAKGDRLQFELDEEDLKLFNEEAEEQLELLDTALVQLEGEPDPELVQQIFRAAHTLKGSSATIGHTKMANLTHAMETVLDAVRQGKREPTSEVVDALLAGLDALRELLLEVTTRVDSGIETGELERALHAVLAGEEAGGQDAAGAIDSGSLGFGDETTQAVLAEMDRGRAAYRVEVDIETSCQLPSIRCFQIVQELEALATIHMSWPSRDEIEAGAGEFSLSAVVTSDETAERICAAINEVSDVASVTATALSPDAAAIPARIGAGSTPAARSSGGPQLEVIEGGGGNGSPKAGPAKKQSTSVRIDVERLDGLMNLVGELVIDRTRLEQIREQLAEVLKGANVAELTENFEETTAHLARVTDELQEEIMRSRMLPVRSVLTRLPRLVRDVAARCGKQVELITAGEETELDRSVIEEISDPLVHIIRNAVDHGIETPEERRAAGKPAAGRVMVTAWNQETYIYLSVKDDGRGIDTDTLRRKVVEKGLVSKDAAEAATDEQVVQYIFLPGLSTAKEISDVSGRGVGMDIVRTNIERLNGVVSVRSTKGAGSEFIIQLPLTLATTKALMVLANETVYAMPLVSVTEALDEDEADIHTVNGLPMLRLRGKLLPTFDLAQSLGDRRPRLAGEPRFVVAARHGDREVAFLVDRLLGEQDVVVKSMGDMIKHRAGISGATILGDGRLGLIIDTASLISDLTRLTATA